MDDKTILLFGGDEDEAKNEVIAFDLSKKIFKRVEIKDSQDIPEPRDFHQAVFYKQKMYVFGGNEKHGKVNYIHSFEHSSQSDQSTLLDEISQFGDDSFEFLFKNDEAKITSLFCP